MNQILNKKSVMIIAGEASGDIHGSRLVMAMHKKNSALFFLRYWRSGSQGRRGEDSC